MYVICGATLSRTAKLYVTWLFRSCSHCISYMGLQLFHFRLFFYTSVSWRLAHELKQHPSLSTDMKNGCPRLDLNFGPINRKLYLAKSITVQHRMTLVRLATLSDILIWGATTLMIHCKWHGITLCRMNHHIWHLSDLSRCMWLMGWYLSDQSL